jgi:hypothetical protein
MSVVWKNLYEMQQIYNKDVSGSNYDLVGFIDWMEENFGIKFFFAKNAEVLEDYAIVDEKKYIVYVLRWA